MLVQKHGCEYLSVIIRQICSLVQSLKVMAHVLPNEYRVYQTMIAILVYVKAAQRKVQRV
jgi:hypothetical protein